MYVGTPEPCVGLIHLLVSFPKTAAVIGCVVAGTYAFPATTSDAVLNCDTFGGEIHQVADEAPVCVVPPPPSSIID